MKIKEDEHFIPGSIDAMRRLNLAMGKAESLREEKTTVSTRDLKLMLSAAKKISEELLRYRVTSREPDRSIPDPLRTSAVRAFNQSNLGLP